MTQMVKPITANRDFGHFIGNYAPVSLPRKGRHWLSATGDDNENQCGVGTPGRII
jgi:hypothetical protein